MILMPGFSSRSVVTTALCGASDVDRQGSSVTVHMLQATQYSGQSAVSTPLARASTPCSTHFYVEYVLDSA